MRDALPQSDINTIAGLIAGGESRSDIEAAYPDVDPAFWERNWAGLERRAARAKPQRFLTPEEVAASTAEGQRLDVMFARRRPLPSAEELTGFTVKRSVGR